MKLYVQMSDLIRRGRSMTTAPSSDPPAQSASAATAPALLDHVVVGPGASQVPASSASSAHRHHRHDIDRGYWCLGITARYNYTFVLLILY
ncbi:hypothetical protein L3X38_025357 [Prunus dulcis]|uniref:Uncharacterized protein n=1 Tax=Prunus dulcis TaxID=3755 RepID=A0AAD4W345_PRUDU|nr:hypothetical protein L3X38_025357 [Prunus dulcis]